MRWRPLCDRVLSALATPVRIAGRTLVMSGSLGVVIGDDDQEPADLLRDADVAMYRSKADGRGRSTLFTASLRAEAVTRLEQEADLRTAVEEGQLEVHYQPVIDAVDGTVPAPRPWCAGTTRRGACSTPATSCPSPSAAASSATSAASCWPRPARPSPAGSRRATPSG